MNVKLSTLLLLDLCGVLVARIEPKIKDWIRFTALNSLPMQMQSLIFMCICMNEYLMQSP